MRFLDLTLGTPAENLACDEALLEWCEQRRSHGILRFWEPRQHFVVLGYANRVRAEVRAERCEELGIPILRRCSGGGTVLQGPGCLNYTLILQIAPGGPLESISRTNEFVMRRNAAAIGPLAGKAVSVQGVTDLTSANLKFSGNAQRRKRYYLLFHGTFLLDFNLSLIEQLLLPPSRQPEYRRARSHAGFLTQLRTTAPRVKAALQQAWEAFEPLDQVPESIVQRLVREKYTADEWNLKW